MDRKEKVLRHINKNGIGIEIGPCHGAVAPKKEGFNVHIIDHLSREELCRKYAEHKINLDKIEEVDFVWDGSQSYVELTGNPKHYDWIIASHVIEHTPDLIGFLNDCDSVMKDDGVVSLVVPDKRYCFDHHRPLTGVSQVIDSHLRKAKVHSPGTVAEYFLSVVSKSGKTSWKPTSGGSYSFVHTLDYAKRKLDDALNAEDYIDVHAWCFIPHSFRLLIHDLHSLGLIPFKEVDFFPTSKCEFYITLGRQGKGSGMTRMQLSKQIEAEIRKGTSEPALGPVRQALRAMRKKKRS